MRIFLLFTNYPSKLSYPKDIFMCAFQQATQMTQCDNGLLHPCCLPMLNKDDHCVACWKAHYGCVQGDAIRVI